MQHNFFFCCSSYDFTNVAALAINTSFSLPYNGVALKEAMWHLQHLFQEIFPLNIVYLSGNVTGCERYPLMNFLEILPLH